MITVQCAVPGCSNEYNARHFFPDPKRDLQRYLKWVEQVDPKLSQLDPLLVYKTKRICHTHFLPEHISSSCRLYKIATPQLKLATQYILCLCLLLNCHIIENLALDLNNLIIIILTQDNPYNIKLATNLKNNIENQALNIGNKELIPVIYQSHIDFPVIGDWTILPLIPKLNSLHSNNISWYIFIDDITEIRLVKLLQTLDKYNPEEKIWLGHALHDEECTIIHHFAFYPDPKWFKYPNIASGVAFSKAMLSWCSDRLILDPSKIDFSIDRSHEMAKYIWNDGEGFALIHDDSFCVEDGEDCSTISQNFNHYCDETRIDPESIYFAVKTYSKFHNDRVPIVLKTWGKQVTNLHFFSDIKDGSIPTINLNVPNTESGHCAKTMAILKYAAKELDKNDRFKWVVLSDDDTLFSIPRLQQFLTCYDPNWIIAIGERYGYNVLSSEGYNYITGGGGTIFSKKMIQLLTKPGNCVCPSPSTPDDMFLGICISKLDGKMVHSPFFHQARPMDYAVNYLKWQTLISFHKHWMIDPLKVYNQYLSVANKFDETHIEL